MDKRKREAFSLSMSGGNLTIMAICETTHDVDDLVFAMRTLGKTLSSHREAVAGDLGIETRPKTLEDKMREAGIM